MAVIAAAKKSGVQTTLPGAHGASKPAPRTTRATTTPQARPLAATAAETIWRSAHRARDTACNSTPAAAEEQAAPPPADAVDEPRVGTARARSRSGDEESLPGSFSEDGGEPYPKRIRISLRALNDDEANEQEWVDEMDADPSDDVKLVLAIQKHRPHATADTTTTWNPVVAQLKADGYSRNLSVQALKRRFGLVIRELMGKPRDDHSQAEFRESVLEYCKSVGHQTPAMKAFVEWCTNQESEPAAEQPQRPTRTRRAPPTWEVPPKEPPAGRAREQPSISRPGDRRAAAPTPASDTAEKFKMMKHEAALEQLRWIRSEMTKQNRQLMRYFVDAEDPRESMEDEDE